jgi:hypothetical protein
LFDLGFLIYHFLYKTLSLSCATNSFAAATPALPDNAEALALTFNAADDHL